MNVTVCLVCDNPGGDSFLCNLCWSAFDADLQDLSGYSVGDRGVRLIPLSVELEVALTRQERLARAKVSITGTPERALPVNLKAGEVRDQLHTVLALWASAVAESRGVHYPLPGTVISNAQFLLLNERAVRNHPSVDELVNTISDVVDKARIVIDARSIRVFVGPCGFTDAEGFTCTAGLWADTAYAMTRCTTCQHSWPSMERWESYAAQVRAGRLAEVHGKRFGARRMAAVLTALGHQVDESTVRKWARLQRIQPAGVDEVGRKTYLAGDVLALLTATPMGTALTA